MKVGSVETLRGLGAFLAPTVVSELLETWFSALVFLVVFASTFFDAGFLTGVFLTAFLAAAVFFAALFFTAGFLAVVFLGAVFCFAAVF